MNTSVIIKYLVKAVYYLSICFLVFPLVLYAQEKKDDIDTLMQKAEKVYAKDPKKGIAIAKQASQSLLSKAPPAKQMKTLYLLTYLYWGVQDFKNARLCAQSGFKIAEENHADSLRGDFLELVGAIDQVGNNYRQALESYRAALPCYKINNLQKRTGNAYVNIGACEMKLAQFETANINFLRSAAIFERLNDKEDLSATYNAMGACFSLLHNDQKAIEYYRAALRVRVQLNENILISQTMNNLGFAFNQNKISDSAIYYLSKSLALQKSNKDTSSFIIILQNLGTAWLDKHDLKRSEAYNIRAIRIAENYNRKEDLAKGYLALADIYTLQNKYPQALIDINKSDNYAKDLGIPDLLLSTYDAKFNLFKKEGDYKNALLYDAKRDSLKDDIFTIAKNKTINELETKYRTSQKEKDIAELHVQNSLEAKSLSQQKQLNIVLVIAAVLLLLLLIIAYYSFRTKLKDNFRIQTLMQDLHHRVKNNLQILSGLFTMQLESLDDEKTKSALRENETRLASMNLIHSKLYMDHSTTKIEMQEYLSKLLQHIKSSFGSNKQNISLRLEIDPLSLEADKAVAIGLIVNELATNAFKYAFDNKPGEIYLSLKQHEKSRVILSIQDNGKGIPDNGDKNKMSFGLKLVNLMARQLNSDLKVKSEMGTSYHMEISL